MSDQMGLLFDDAPRAAVSLLHPAGTWSGAAFSLEEYGALFQRAQDRLLGLAGPGRPLFRAGLELAQKNHEAMHRCGNREGAYRIWRCDFKPSRDEALAFVAHCAAHAAVGSTVGGCEYQYRQRKQHQLELVAAMYVDGIGSLVLRSWGTQGFAVDFTFGRDSALLTSYRDTQREVYAPVAVWHGACAAMALSEQRVRAPSVKTVAVGGREYVVTGTMSCRNYAEATAWTFRPVADWPAETMTRAELLAAWDLGTIERGNDIGLLVTVRGQLCVLDGPARLVDTDAKWPHMEHDDAPEDTPDADE